MKKNNRRLSKIMRTLGRLAFATAIDLIVITGALADGIFNKWFFTADSIEAAYRYQEDYGERIRNSPASQAMPFRQRGICCFLSRR